MISVILQHFRSQAKHHRLKWLPRHSAFQWIRLKNTQTHTDANEYHLRTQCADSHTQHTRFVG